MWKKINNKVESVCDDVTMTHMFYLYFILHVWHSDTNVLSLLYTVYSRCKEAAYDHIRTVTSVHR